MLKQLQWLLHCVVFCKWSSHLFLSWRTCGRGGNAERTGHLHKGSNQRSWWVLADYYLWGGGGWESTFTTEDHSAQVRAVSWLILRFKKAATELPQRKSETRTIRDRHSGETPQGLSCLTETPRHGQSGTDTRERLLKDWAVSQEVRDTDNQGQTLGRDSSRTELPHRDSETRTTRDRHSGETPQGLSCLTETPRQGQSGTDTRERLLKDWAASQRLRDTDNQGHSGETPQRLSCLTETQKHGQSGTDTRERLLKDWAASQRLRDTDNQGQTLGRDSSRTELPHRDSETRTIRDIHSGETPQRLSCLTETQRHGQSGTDTQERLLKDWAASQRLRDTDNQGHTLGRDSSKTELPHRDSETRTIRDRHSGETPQRLSCLTKTQRHGQSGTDTQERLLKDWAASKLVRDTDNQGQTLGRDSSRTELPHRDSETQTIRDRHSGETPQGLSCLTETRTIRDRHSGETPQRLSCLKVSQRHGQSGTDTRERLLKDWAASKLVRDTDNQGQTLGRDSTRTELPHRDSETRTIRYRHSGETPQGLSCLTETQRHGQSGTDTRERLLKDWAASQRLRDTDNQVQTLGRDSRTELPHRDSETQTIRDRHSGETPQGLSCLTETPRHGQSGTLGRDSSRTELPHRDSETWTIRDRHSGETPQGLSCLTDTRTIRDRHSGETPQRLSCLTETQRHGQSGTLGRDSSKTELPHRDSETRTIRDRHSGETPQRLSCLTETPRHGQSGTDTRERLLKDWAASQRLRDMDNQGQTLGRDSSKTELPHRDSETRTIRDRHSGETPQGLSCLKDTQRHGQSGTATRERLLKDWAASQRLRDTDRHSGETPQRLSCLKETPRHGQSGTDTRERLLKDWAASQRLRDMDNQGQTLGRDSSRTELPHRDSETRTIRDIHLGETPQRLSCLTESQRHGQSGTDTRERLLKDWAASQRLRDTDNQEQTLGRDSSRTELPHRDSETRTIRDTRERLLKDWAASQRLRDTVNQGQTLGSDSSRTELPQRLRDTDNQGQTLGRDSSKTELPHRDSETRTIRDTRERLLKDWAASQRLRDTDNQGQTLGRDFSRTELPHKDSETWTIRDRHSGETPQGLSCLTETRTIRDRHSGETPQRLSCLKVSQRHGQSGTDTRERLLKDWAASKLVRDTDNQGQTLGRDSSRTELPHRDSETRTIRYRHSGETPQGLSCLTETQRHGQSGTDTRERLLKDWAASQRLRDMDNQVQTLGRDSSRTELPHRDSETQTIRDRHSGETPQGLSCLTETPRHGQSGTLGRDSSRTELPHRDSETWTIRDRHSGETPQGLSCLTETPRHGQSGTLGRDSSKTELPHRKSETRTIRGRHSGETPQGLSCLTETQRHGQSGTDTRERLLKDWASSQRLSDTDNQGQTLGRDSSKTELPQRKSETRTISDRHSGETPQGLSCLTETQRHGQSGTDTRERLLKDWAASQWLRDKDNQAHSGETPQGLSCLTETPRHGQSGTDTRERLLKDWAASQRLRDTDNHGQSGTDTRERLLKDWAASQRLRDTDNQGQTLGRDSSKTELPHRDSETWTIRDRQSGETPQGLSCLTETQRHGQSGIMKDCH